MDEGEGYMLEPVKKVRLYEAIVKQLQDLISSNKLKPGEKLPPERQLAEELNVSRTSIREALRTLEMMGYLESKVGISGGTFVKDITMETVVSPFSKILVRNGNFITDLLETRLVLEIEVARLAALRRNDEDLEKIASAVKNMENEIKDGGTGINGDNEFHRALGSAAHNDVLLNMVKMCGDLMEMQREEHLSNLEGEPERALKSHKAILKAVKEKDEEKAQSLMRKHITNLQSIIKEAAK